MTDRLLALAARTPPRETKGGTTGFGGGILPPYNQDYLEKLVRSHSHTNAVITRLADGHIERGISLIPTVEDPSPEQQQLLFRLLTNPTNGAADITGHEMLKAISRAYDTFDDAWVSITSGVVNYDGDEVTIPDQLFIEDTKRMRFNVDDRGNFRTDEWFCPSCLDEGGAEKAEMNIMDGVCAEHPNMKCKLVAYFYDLGGATGGAVNIGKRIPFARTEILHSNQYSTGARLYGESRLVGLARQIETALAIEMLIRDTYVFQRPPRSLVNIPGMDGTALKEMQADITAIISKNPNDIPIISSKKATTATAQVLNLLPSFTELDTIKFLQAINHAINAALGITPIIVGDVVGLGALNTQEEQVRIYNRTIVAKQQAIERGFIDPLRELFQITDWEARYNSTDPRDENEFILNLRDKVDIAVTMRQELEIDATIDRDGNLIHPDNLEVPLPNTARPRRSVATSSKARKQPASVETRRKLRVRIL